MVKPTNLPSPGLPIQVDRPGEVATAAARIDEAALHRKNAIPSSKLSVGDKVTDPRTNKDYTIDGVGVRAGIPVYVVTDADGQSVLRNQDEFDEAQAGVDIPIDITPGPLVKP